MQAWETLRCSGEYNEGLIELAPKEAIDTFKLAMGHYIMGGARGFWLEPEAKDGHCDPAQLVVDLGTRVDAFAELQNGPRLGSPIEHRMAAAMLWMPVEWAGLPRVDMLGGPRDHLAQFGPSDALEFYITPQFQVASYRADFLVWFMLKTHYAGVIVECDGHAFHEKTKEQAARDKKRDRELLTAGFPVLRFTGSEIFSDAIGCADQVRDALEAPLDRVSKDGGLY
jgi:very-short-patch-repair endonuclease